MGTVALSRASQIETRQAAWSPEARGQVAFSDVPESPGVEPLLCRPTVGPEMTGLGAAQPRE